MLARSVQQVHGCLETDCLNQIDILLIYCRDELRERLVCWGGGEWESFNGARQWLVTAHRIIPNSLILSLGAEGLASAFSSRSSHTILLLILTAISHPGIFQVFKDAPPLAQGLCTHRSRCLKLYSPHFHCIDFYSSFRL